MSRTRFVRHGNPDATKVEKLLAILGDGRWHSTKELARRVSHAFAVAIFKLRGDHYLIERRKQPMKRYQHQYRIRRQCSD